MPNYRTIIPSCDWLDSPEWNVAIFAFLLSFFWEVQQMPFYQVPSEISCFGMIRNCTLATVGDVGIALTSFWAVAAISKSRQWIRQPDYRQVSVFIFVSILITIIFEALATKWLGIWSYADLMPTVPILGTGLVPLLMWLVIPTLTIWFVKRQLGHLKKS